MEFNGPLKQQIAAEIPALLAELGFACSHDHHDPAHFGDSQATLSGGAFDVRITRDRGLLGFEFCAHEEPREWWDLADVTRLIAGPSAVAQPQSLADLGAYLRLHADALREAFQDSPGPNRERLRAIRDARVGRWTRWLQRKDDPDSAP